MNTHQNQNFIIYYGPDFYVSSCTDFLYRPCKDILYRSCTDFQIETQNVKTLLKIGKLEEVKN